MTSFEMITAMRDRAQLELSFPKADTRVYWSLTGEGTGEMVDIGYGDSAETVESIGGGNSPDFDSAVSAAYAKFERWLAK